MRFLKKSKRMIYSSLLLTAFVCIGTIGIKTYAKLSEDTVIYKKKIVSNHNLNQTNNEITEKEETVSEKNSKQLNIDSEEIIIEIPTVNTDIWIENYGAYNLSKEQKIIADVSWDGTGSILFLYTAEKLNEEEILSLLERGILPSSYKNKTFKGSYSTSLSSNFIYKTRDKDLKLNFSMSMENSIYWSNQVPDTGEYYIYIIAVPDKGIENIQGSISVK